VSRRLQHHCFDPKQLGAEERERYIDALFSIQQEIFDVSLDDRAGFVAYVFDSPAQQNRIHVFSDNALGISQHFVVVERCGGGDDLGFVDFSDPAAPVELPETLELSRDNNFGIASALDVVYVSGDFAVQTLQSICQ
jgi:hypothetical protein